MLLLVAHHIAAAAAVVAADGKGTQHMVHRTAAAAAAVGTVADSWDRAVAAVVAAGSGDGPTDPTGAVRTDRCTVAVAADGGGGSGKYSLMGGRRGEEEEVGDYVGQGGGEIVSPPYRAALSRSTSLKVSGSCD